jgi:putative ABC transport system ATP-binding protein
MDSTLLSLDAVAHAFDYPLFSDVSFSLAEGESMAVVGRSGSGKSTLLHIASSFLKPLEGEVRIKNEPLYTKDTRAIERLRRYDIGIVFQSHYLFKGMTGRENIEAACLLAGTQLEIKLLEMLEIADVIDQKTSELSGGQQQRVSVARVLAKKPKLLFADEPTGNLDGETAALVTEVLLTYIRDNDAALMMVTHDEALARRCDKLYRLDNAVLKEER